jgi:hypothetical protein
MTRQFSVNYSAIKPINLDQRITSESGDGRSLYLLSPKVLQNKIREEKILLPDFYDKAGNFDVDHIPD